MFSLFTKTCLLCHVSGEKLCSGCLNDLRALYMNASECCPKCAQWSTNGQICDRCRVYPPPFEKVWACAQYADILKGILFHWKHLQQREFAYIFQILLQENPPVWLPESQIDGVLAMPMSRQRRVHRGFNQCDELTKMITQHYKIPLLPHDGVFRQPAPPQSTLNAAQRKQNIREAFRIDCDVNNRKILIIDDVMTTGATLNELARTLRQSGASAIFACVMLRNL